MMDTKIAICFVIILFIPYASSGKEDMVWTAKFSGFINSNESLPYEDYLIKAVKIDNERAALSISKDYNLIDKKDFKVSEFKRYGSIGITLIGIKNGVSWISISKLENQDIWVFLEKIQLKWGESYTIENHTFSIDTMTRDSVSLTTTNKTITRTITFKKGSPIDNDNLRTVVTDINNIGIIELEFYIYSIPTLKAEISTNKSKYFPDEFASIAVNITVNGSMDVIGIILSSSPSSKIKPGMVSAANVSGAKTFQSYLSELPENSSITINAHIEAIDYLKNRYFTDIKTIINTTPVIYITKLVPEDTEEDNVTVTLNIHNSGKEVEYVSVYDSIPVELTARQLEWLVEMQPGNSTNLYYKVSPGKPGEYVFPPAIAKWKRYSTSSAKVNMTSHGPYLVIKKSAVRKNNLTDVDTIIENTGDRPAQVNFTDEIPDGSYLEKGSHEWQGYIDGGKSKSIKYSLRGDIKSLPPASAAYRDLGGTIRKAQSSSVTKITVEAAYKPEVVTTPKEKTLADAGQSQIISFMILSFIVLSTIIGSIALGAYLIRNIKARQK